jgi:hypothetical protein
MAEEPNKSDQEVRDRRFYTNYFKDNIEKIEQSLAMVDKYAAIIDKEIADLSPKDGAFPQRGTQMYLAQHMENAISLLAQRKELQRDMVAIKKLVLDYSIKDERANNADDDKSLYDILNKLVESNKKAEDAKAIGAKLTEGKTDSEIDAEIEKEVRDAEKAKGTEKRQ